MLPKYNGPFKSIEANRDTVTVDEKGITNIISIDRTKYVPRGQKRRRGSGKGAENGAQATEEQKIDVGYSENADSTET